MLIGGLQKSSMIDYPEKISAIIFTQGCNFRCPYCHNPELINNFGSCRNNIISSETKNVLNPASHINKHENEIPNMTYNIKTKQFMFRDDVLNFLKSRVGKLDGVVITGGEPTLQKGLEGFIREIKDLGFLVKLDTNGTNPDILQRLLDENLIDYIAMDIKSPIEKYNEIVCANVEVESILKSIELVKNSNLGYEFRTTVVKSQLTLEDFEKIGGMLSGAEKYYLQKFIPTKTLDENFMTQATYSDEEFADIILLIKKYVENVEVR